VFKIETEDEIRKHFEETLSFSRSKKYILAERYINGIEFTIDGVKTKDDHYTLAISKKKHYEHNENIANELYFSHYDDEYDYEKLKEINDAYVMTSGLEYGLTHAEYKFENGQFYLIEIAARGGGNMISSIITTHMSGYHPYDYLIHCSLGEKDNSSFPILDNCLNRCAVLKFFESPINGGAVKEVRGEEYLRNNSNIKKYMLNFKIGDQIGDCINDSSRIGRDYARIDKP